MNSLQKAICHHKGTAFSALIAAVALCLPGQASAANLEKIRAAKHEKFVRIVFDLDTATKASVVGEGSDFVLEFDDLKTDINNKSYANMGRVKGVEIVAQKAAPNENKTQVRFNLSDAVRPRLFTYTPDYYGGHRIVVDLWSVDASKENPSAPKLTQQSIPDLQVAKADPQPTAQPKTKSLPRPQPKPIANTSNAVPENTPVTPPSSGERQTRKEPIRIEGMKTEKKNQETFGADSHSKKTEAISETTARSDAEEPEVTDKKEKPVLRVSPEAKLEPQAKSQSATNGPIRLPTLAIPPIEKPGAIEIPEVKAPEIKQDPIEKNQNQPQDPNEAGLHKAAHVTDPLGQAREKLNAGHPQEACALIKDHYPKGSWNLQAMMLEGRCLIAMNKQSEAASLFAEILSYDPENNMARQSLAGSQAELGDLSSARDNYVRLLGSLEDGAERKEIEKTISDLEKRLKKNAY